MGKATGQFEGFEAVHRQDISAKTMEVKMSTEEEIVISLKCRK